jgi:hypothetical protein
MCGPAIPSIDQLLVLLAVAEAGATDMNRDRADARYRIADDRCAQQRLLSLRPKFESCEEGILNTPPSWCANLGERYVSQNPCRSSTLATPQLERERGLCCVISAKLAEVPRPDARGAGGQRPL